MKKLIFSAFVICLLAACRQSGIGKFEVEGELKGAADQKVFLEQIPFNQEAPQVLDTSEMRNGKFALKANSNEEGLYRIRFEQNPAYLFINDKKDIRIIADSEDSTLKSTRVSSPATTSLYHFIVVLDSAHTKMLSDDQTRQMFMQSGNDSMATAVSNSFAITQKWTGDYIRNYADTSKSPVVALFALSYAMDMVRQDTVFAMLDKIKKKWPNSTSVKEVAKQFDAFAQNQQQGTQMQQGLPVGTVAPEITMDDPDGKPFSLSTLRGKYVLVDFWASWCGPCRAENPNVVNAYEQYKNKNFTILGVSLDQSRTNWLKAIKDDKLDWKQISDLKFWESAAVPLYQIQGIPYNVLIDPQGKIIASELRGPALEAKLAEVLK